MNRTGQARKAARRLFRGCLVETRLDENRARQVALGIIESRRRDGFAILSHFERLVRLDIARHTATVESAVPLPDDLRARIDADLTRAYGRGLKTSFVRDPSLIGGMRIKVGSAVCDGSILGRLRALEARL